MERMLDLVLNGIYVESHGMPEQWPGLVGRWQNDIRGYIQQGLLTEEEAKRAQRELEKPMRGGGTPALRVLVSSPKGAPQTLTEVSITRWS